VTTECLYITTVNFSQQRTEESTVTRKHKYLSTMQQASLNFHIHTVHLDIIKVFFTNWCTSEMS